tara:strand:+ start:936 stop:1142 length:207 start_codon:yes stop_codon:yes gene_type:complete
MPLSSTQLEKLVEQSRKQLLASISTLSAKQCMKLTKQFQELEKLQNQLKYAKFRERERAEARWMHGEY